MVILSAEIFKLYYPLFMEVDLFGTLIVLVLLFRLIIDSRIRGQREFRRLLVWEVILFISEALSEGLLNHINGNTYRLFILFKSMYFVACVICSCTCFVYFEHCRNSTWSAERRFAFWAGIPVYFYSVLVLLNIRYGFLFRIDNAQIYRRGPSFEVTYILCFAYAAAMSARSLADAFRGENYADRGYYILLGVFPAVPITAGLVQYFYPSLPVMCPAMTIFSIIIFTDAMEQLIYTDPLTSLDNRRSFLREIVIMMRNLREENRLYFAMIDINDFKSINDTYGHTVGDAALVIMADAMRKCAYSRRNRPDVCRYGGDEFAVVLSSADEGEIRRYLDDVVKEISVLSDERKMPCRILFSAGVAVWNGKDDPGKFTAGADREMYLVKSKYHSR